MRLLLISLAFLALPLFVAAQDAHDYEINPPYECSPIGASAQTLLPPACVARSSAGLSREASQLTDAFCRSVPLTPVTEAQLNALFAEMRDDPRLPFRFLPDGCQARAQRMAQILISRGIQPGKIFVKGGFQFPDPFNSSWTVKWQYHVAPVLAVELAQGAKELRVIDPSLFSKPVSVHEFISKFASFPVSRIDEIYFTSAYVYEINHRALELRDFRDRDLVCTQEMLSTGLSMQRVWPN